MSVFQLATDQQKQVWSTDVTREYVRESGFKPYMATKGGIINVQNELLGSAGNVIHVPALAKLRGAVVRGNTTLVNNEDAQSSYSMRITTDVVRTATTFKLTDSFKTEMDLFKEGQTAVTNRLGEALRDDLITAFQSIPVPGASTGANPEDAAVSYGTATPSQQNAWLLANADRVLYGSANANMVAGNHASSVANINTSSASLAANKLSGKVVSLARKKARATTNSGTFAISPYKTKTGQEWYVMFVDSNGYRDCKFDPVIYAANKDSRPREVDIMENPIFSGTNTLYYDGVIIVEMPELPTVATGVGYSHLCGIQAVNLGYSMKVKPSRRKEDDYEMVVGIGATEIRGQQKASFNLTQLGMVSVFNASVDDA